MPIEILPLSQIAEVIAGQSPTGDNYNSDGEGTPFYQGKKKFTEKYIGAPKVWTRQVTKVAQKNDILMSVRAPVGPVNIATEECCIGRGLAAIRAKPGRTTQEYLYYFLLSIQRKLVGKEGAVFDSINRDQIAAIDVPVPDLDVQAEIVSRLDFVLAQIQELASIYEAEELQAAALAEVFRDQHLATKTSAIEAVPFGSVGQFVRGPFGGSLKKNSFRTSGYAVYEQQHAINDQTSEFRYFVDDSKFKEMQRFSVKPHDLLMSCSGTFGKMTIVKPDAPEGIINQALLKISLQENVLPEFMKQWMQSAHFQGVLEGSVGGAALQNVPAVSEMKKFPVKIPSVDVQKEVVLDLAEFAEKVQLLKHLVDERTSTLKELRESFLIEAFQA